MAAENTGTSCALLNSSRMAFWISESVSESIPDVASVINTYNVIVGKPFTASTSYRRRE